MLTTAIQVNLGMISLSDKRGDEEARGVGRHHCRADDDRRHLRHELQAHAGARVGVRLSARHRVDGRRSTRYLLLTASSARAGCERRARRAAVRAGASYPASASCGRICVRRRDPRSARPGSRVPRRRTGHAGCSVTWSMPKSRREHPLRRREHARPRRPVGRA